MVNIVEAIEYKCKKKWFIMNRYITQCEYMGTKVGSAYCTCKCIHFDCELYYNEDLCKGAIICKFKSKKP